VIACNRKRELLEGVVYIYKGTEQLHSLHVQEPIHTFIYGPYGFGEQGFIFNTSGILAAIRVSACYNNVHGLCSFLEFIPTSKVLKKKNLDQARQNNHGLKKLNNKGEAWQDRRAT
jgi:hypothetical protein